MITTPAIPPTIPPINGAMDGDDLICTAGLYRTVAKSKIKEYQLNCLKLNQNDVIQTQSS
jgi:hypothetical protein